MRTRRPVFARVLLDLQTGKAGALICDDVSRIARDERDALDLIDGPYPPIPQTLVSVAR